MHNKEHIRALTTNTIVFTLIGPLMVPLWFIVWDSWSPHSSFKLPSFGGYLLSATLFGVFGAIPAYLTGVVSGALYNQSISRNKWVVVATNTIVTVISGCVLSFLAVYCLSSLVFSSKYDEPGLLAGLAALMGACSSFFCSLLIACRYLWKR